MTTGRATVVLVHGAWSGAWMWDRVVESLGERGIAARAVDLPSCGEGVTPPVGLRDDEEAVRALLRGITGDVVLCGHSYGGMVVTGAAHGQAAVRRLVYLAAFMPEPGESLLGTFSGAVPSFWRIRDDLTVVPQLDGSAASDLSPEDRALLAARRVPQSLLAYTQAPGGTAWQVIPSTYAICTRDTSIPVERQRVLAARADDTVELPTGHQPMLVRPDLVADLLGDLAT